MKTWKKVSALVVLLVSMLLASVFVSAASLNLQSVMDLESVKVDGTTLSSTMLTKVDLERGNTFDVRIQMNSGDYDLKDVELSVFISGYEYNDVKSISDSTSTFDMDMNTTYVKRLSLTLPDNVEEDEYKLRLMVTDRDSGYFMQDFLLKIDVPRKDMKINDVVFNPEYDIKAGRSLLTLVRVENTGQKDQEGVKVSVSIPELKVSASDYIDEVESDEEVTSEALYMKLPTCAKAGTYNVDVVVTYDSSYRTVKKTVPLTVVADDACDLTSGSNTGSNTAAPEKTIITVGPTSQKVAAGNGAVFPVTLTNAGKTAKTYTLSVEGVSSWANLKVTPSNVVLVNGGESKTAYVTVTPDATTSAGDMAFVITVKSGEDVLQQIAASVSVSGAAAPAKAAESQGWDKVKKGLEIGLVVLVVLLVILGLIIAFNKMKNDEDEEESGDAGQTYY
ncbi:hypothetical protein COV93_03620 [Candidatus Woesearchaeota archaeon CG11_big_fil_rev_8_21_14_0_20_43_8]|nr:MAG: hypothetical protein COV93_03620 [Candidatus Woesearchaeota archaeon CG11_big_fil_rev_8_21_14_0_20_43_8]PIO08897.1 MAG: hypothetical protein COT47_00720 [Candidatus Woesearchaeota archaeon CG08_land_8_20_14_0_20_43_7]